MSSTQGIMNKSFVTIVSVVALFFVINVSVLLRKDTRSAVFTMPIIRQSFMAGYRIVVTQD